MSQALDVGLHDDVQEGLEEVEDEPDIDHLDVSGVWEAGGDADEQGGQHQHHRHIQRHQALEEKLLEVVGHVADDVE